MKSRDIVIGFIFLVILVAGVLWIYKNKNSKNLNIPLSTPNIVSRINEAFPNLNIPENVERANLRDVNGGESVGVATRTEIVANLPSDQVYSVLLENLSRNKINIGTMRISKSGWILEYDASKYQNYNKIIIMKGSTPVLEGSF